MPGRRKGTRGPERYYGADEQPLTVHVGNEARDADELTFRRNVFTHAAIAGPEFVKRLEAVLAELKAIPADGWSEDCLFARGLCAHWRAVLDAYFDDPRRGPLSGSNLVLLALDEADLRCVARYGRPMRGPTDYRNTKPPWGPSATTIYELFGKPFTNVLQQLALASTAQGEAHLMRPLGSPKGACPLTVPERAELVAQGMEFNYGRRMTMDGWDDIRERIAPRRLPTAKQLIGARTVKGKSEFSWDALQDLAVEMALKNPTRFPVTSRRIRRVRAREAARVRERARQGITPPK